MITKILHFIQSTLLRLRPQPFFRDNLRSKRSFVSCRKTSHPLGNEILTPCSFHSRQAEEPVTAPRLVYQNRRWCDYHTHKPDLVSPLDPVAALQASTRAPKARAHNPSCSRPANPVIDSLPLTLRAAFSSLSPLRSDSVKKMLSELKNLLLQKDRSLLSDVLDSCFNQFAVA